MKSFAFWVLAASAAAHAQQPVRREVPDPGVVATGQRINPSGMQTVLEGKVAGVRFGKSSDEVWVAVPGNALARECA